MLDYLVPAFIVLVAGITQSATGFGFALVAVPLLLFVLDPKSVVALAIVLSFIMAVMRIIHLWKYIDYRRLAMICIGCAFGLPIGIYILSTVDPSVLKIVIAGVIIPFSIVLLLGFSYRFKRDNLGTGIAGFISGILTAGTSLGGPPVVLYFLSQDMDKKVFVGTVTANILIIGAVTMGAHACIGVLTLPLLRYAVIFVPVLILGFYIGNKILHAISATLFKKVSSLIILLSALSVIVITLRAVYNIQ